jgi:hypothetical protein
MAVPDTTSNDDADAAPIESASVVGPLRDPDACVLACRDCTCRRLLEARRACGRGDEPVA